MIVKAEICNVLIDRLAAVVGVGAVAMDIQDVGLADVMSARKAAIEVLIDDDQGGSENPGNQTNAELMSFNVVLIIHFHAVEGELATERFTRAAELIKLVYGVYAGAELGQFGGLARYTQVTNLMGAVVIDPEAGTNVVTHAFVVHYGFNYGDAETAA